MEAADIRAQLEKLLAGPLANAPSLARFLRFIVDRTLEGDTASLKESVLGIEVFQRGSDFDPKADSIVRIQAANLRSRLARYYENEGARDPIHIEIPKGAYVPVFTARSGSSRHRPRLWVAAGVVIVASFVLAIFLLFGRKPGPVIRSVAVLPFVDLTPAHDQEYLCDGLSEEIIDALTKLPGLRVAARTSAFAFKGKPVDIREIGRRLDVGAVLEGSVRREGDRLRITAQLNRASDGFHLWSESFDRAATGVLDVEREISQAIAGRLLGRSPIPSSATALDPEAHRLYLEGRYLLEQQSSETLVKAVERFERANRLQPDQPLFLAGLVYARYYESDAGLVRPTEGMPAARELARRAVALDPRSSEAHAALGIVLLFFDWDWTAAETEFRTALSLSPGNAQYHHWLAHSLEAQGRLEEARAEFASAVQSDPLSLIILVDSGIDLHWAGRDEEALALYRRALDLQPAAPGVPCNILESLVTLGRRDEAARVPAPSDPLLAAWATVQRTALLNPSGVPAAVRELDRKMGDQPRLSVLGAVAHAMAGDSDGMIRNLEQGYRERDPEMIFIHLDPWLDTTDPRYRDLLRRMNLIRKGPPRPRISN